MRPRFSVIHQLISCIVHNPAITHIFDALESARYCWTHRSKHPSFGARIHFKILEVEDFVVINDNSRLYDARIGRMSYVGPNCRITKASIGRFCSIGPNVTIGLGGTHPTDWVSTHPAFYSPEFRSSISFADKPYFDEYPGPVTIGNDVWIGAGASLIDGVTVGDGAVIAAGSMVTKDVPPYAVFAGIPAKLIRHRFAEDIVVQLLSIAWWDRDLFWIQEHYKDFHAISSFCQEHHSDAVSPKILGRTDE